MEAPKEEHDEKQVETRRMSTSWHLATELGDSERLFLIHSITALGVIDELCTETFFPPPPPLPPQRSGWVKPLVLNGEACSPPAGLTTTVWLLSIRAVIPTVMCCGSPRGSTAARRSIHRLSVPSHRRPLPPCAATPALNGESPSGGEARRPEGSGERRRDAELPSRSRGHFDPVAGRRHEGGTEALRPRTPAGDEDYRRNGATRQRAEETEREQLSAQVTAAALQSEAMNSVDV
ncbi:hypothetical protein L3Q82_007902 [Scortum barcoo]|uniref:Uncharacterized protein n=1 Tax=Scortum barcoo TaxID=214431 RepID=A0ACB8WKB2_9TELE|nr:hypothetical protein L3Q82_007902 [Scortum barcoo]